MPNTQNPAAEEVRSYGAKITAQGAALLADCLLRGEMLKIAEAAAGDGGGAYYEPTVDQQELKNEMWRGMIASAQLSPTTPNMIDVKIVMGDDVGGFTIREMGLFSDTGVLIAVCNMPDTEKVSISNGVSGKLTMMMHIIVADTSVLEFIINPSLDIVSREDLEEALAAKQDVLTGQPGEVVGFDATGAAAAVRGWSNPDLLDNSHFYDPVNQQRQSEYISGGYTIDRWSATSGLIVLLEDGWIKLQNNTDSDQYFWQNLEPERFGLGSGNKVTLSTLYKSNVSGSRVILKYAYDDDWKEGFVFNANLGQTDGEFALGAVASNNALPSVNVKRFQLLFEIAPNSTLYLKTAKLELGSQQTLAHQDADGNWVLNDPPPNKALELLKCQRYYRVYATQSVRPNEALDCNPVMRINPTQTTIEINGATYYVNDANL